ncbi:MAG TPA: MlaD family protein [Anseongella sp.]
MRKLSFTMKIAKETKIGVLAAVAIAILIIGYNFLKGNNVFSDSQQFYAIYDRVDGLTESKPIYVNGFQVGRVARLELLPNKKIRATLEVNGNTPIPEGTIAEIQSTDLLGSKAIYFVLGSSEKMAQNEDTLASNVEKSLAESVNPVKDKAVVMLDKIDSILTALNSIMNPEFQDNIHKSLVSINNTLQSLESTSKKVDNIVGTGAQRVQRILDNVESITNNLRENNEQITGIMGNIEQVTDQVAAGKLQETLLQANQATTQLAATMKKIEDGEGSLGALLNDQQLYDNLTNSAENLDKLMIDLRENPKRYVHFSLIDFGGKK